ncbi:MAG: glutamyl-tRNA reductase [Dermatophilaceae bacterium]
MPLLAVGASHHHLGSEDLAALEFHGPQIAALLTQRPDSWVAHVGLGSAGPPAEPDSAALSAGPDGTAPPAQPGNAAPPVERVGAAPQAGAPEDPAQGTGIAGHVLLATCNRFELYLDSPSFHGGVERALAAVRESLPDRPGIIDAMQVHAGDSVAEHLFSVACGLDSMVVGEAQIAGQVRAALATAQDTATPALRRLFQDALQTAKAVTKHTDLGSSGRSLASVGLDLVEQHHGPVRGQRVLVVGTGDFAGVVVAELARRDARTIDVHSRTGRAQEFALTHPAVTPVPPGGLAEALTRADVLVLCSRPGAQPLDAATLARARADARQVLPVLDLSMSGELTPEAADLVHVDVLTLDEIGAHAPHEHASALVAAQDLVERGVAAYLHLEEGRTAAPAVTAMRSYVSRIIAREAELATRRYPPETADAIARSLRRVSGALLHTPSVRAAELAREGELDDYLHALNTLFGIVVDER